MVIAPGICFAHYLIRAQIGSGGMGEVYEAQDQKLLRTVAIKFITQQRLEHRPADARKRFLREARSACCVNHPNIVTIYEIGETDEHAYIVMEYVRGRSLRDFIRTRELPYEQIIEAAMQTSDALAAAHAQGIIHRDIKPENILLTDSHQVKLLDFGVARLLQNSVREFDERMPNESLTDSGALVGTLAYMSPEQLRHEAIDERTDIFCFGIVLYELIIGWHPFHGANSYEIAAAISDGDAANVDALPPDLPWSVAALLGRLLEKDHARRIASFAEVKRELQAIKNELAASLHKPEELAPTMPFISKPARAPQRKPSPPPASYITTLAETHTPPKILVMPLEAINSQESETFIGVGLAYAITTDLAKINNLSVLSKAAGAGRVDNRGGDDARTLAGNLGATILLEGEVMRAGQKIGIMARLIDVESGRVIWGEQYRGDEENLFDIQDGVCRGVAAALKVNISSEVRGDIARPATLNITAFERYSKGRAFLERREINRNIDFAIDMFEQALKIDPHFALAQAGLGEAYWLKYEATHDKSWVSRALAANDRALVLDPNLAQVHVSMGMAYYGTERIDRAIEEFTRAIELQPLNDDAHRWLARCYMQKGAMDDALDCFHKAIEIRPGYWDNYNRLGIYYYTLGRYQDAAEQFRRVITIQPDKYHGYDNLGAMYCLLGLYEDAVAMHRRAIEIHPAAMAYSNLGNDYFYLGRYDEAIEAYENAIELEPKHDIRYRNLGDAYLHTGRKQDAAEQFKFAIKLLDEALNVRPDNAQLLGRLAICHAKLNNGQEALATIERAITIEPHSPKLMYGKAVIYALTGHIDEAVECLAQALAQGHSRAEAERDPDLEALRDRTEYKDLFATAN
ncbi:MAG: tetratricopeptide repeat protein [Pyrinomonadaceae bacterium]